MRIPLNLPRHLEFEVKLLHSLQNFFDESLQLVSALLIQVGEAVDTAALDKHVPAGEVREEGDFERGGGDLGGLESNIFGSVAWCCGRRLEGWEGVSKTAKELVQKFREWDFFHRLVKQLHEKSTQHCSGEQQVGMARRKAS